MTWRVASIDRLPESPSRTIHTASTRALVVALYESGKLGVWDISRSAHGCSMWGICADRASRNDFS